MKRRILLLLLVLALVGGLLPGAMALTPAAQPEPTPLVEGACPHILKDNAHQTEDVTPCSDTKLIAFTPQRVKDTFAYLDEHYIVNHPQAALEMNTGTEEDREILKTLAEIITKDCTTDREKANAIDGWLRRNIVYGPGSGYAVDTFYTREGNCLSYANLMQYLLRSLGIRAVIGDGWRGNMAEDTAELFNYAGHAWCFVYLDNAWVLYDPLWLVGGTSDRDYIAKWIYLDTVEYVTPAVDRECLPPEMLNSFKIYCEDGLFYGYSNSTPYGTGNLTYYVNDTAVWFSMCQTEDSVNGPFDGRIYMDGRSTEEMKRGEVFRDGWIGDGELAWQNYGYLLRAYSNGMQLSGTVDRWNGTLYYMDFFAYPIEITEPVWSIRNGVFTLPVGYTGKYLGATWGPGTLQEYHVVTYESLNPEIATVDENNVVTTHAEGFCEVEIEAYRKNGTLIRRGICTFYVTDEERVPSYEDTHEHTYESQVTAPTCEEEGYTTYRCTICGYAYEDNFTAALGHQWQGTDCTRCDAVREIPFNDVADGKYYYDPIVWAYENNITSGTSAYAFSPNNDCTRGQIVTFLWRAAGQPEPTSTVNPFTDVEEDDFYYKAVLWAVEEGITTGASATKFNPKGACNRAQVVTFMYRAFGSPAVSNAGNPFEDVPADKYYHDAVLWAVAEGITTGMNATRFAPNNTCTRGQIVTFLYRGYAE